MELNCINCEKLTKHYCNELEHNKKNISLEIRDTADNIVKLLKAMDKVVNNNVNVFLIEITIDLSNSLNYILESEHGENTTFHFELFSKYINTIYKFLNTHAISFQFKIGFKLPVIRNVNHEDMHDLYLCVVLLKSYRFIDFIYCDINNVDQFIKLLNKPTRTRDLNKIEVRMSPFRSYL
jgi:hypothetical protein